MASIWLPFTHIPTFADLKRVYDRPIPLGSAALGYLGLSALSFLIHDVYCNFYPLPLDRRTLVANTGAYVVGGVIRLFRTVRGLDGTDARPIRRFVARQPKDGEDLLGKRFLAEDELPTRRGPRPTLFCHGVPQRQVSQVLDPKLNEALESAYRDLAAKYPVLRIGPSEIENGLALVYTSPSPTDNERLHPDIARSLTCPTIEFAHTHLSENSQHLVLAPLDAAHAVDQGWAIRFPLAGAKGPFGEEGRVMVYAPRDAEEVVVVGRLAEAAVRWVMERP